MEYSLKTLSVKDLIRFIESDTLDLSPSYQREFIWSLNDQKELINTIYKKYPLPNLFFNVLKNGKIEMVDGQQRSRSIYRFYKNEIKFTKKDTQQNLEDKDFLNYQIPVIYIENALPEEIREFYVLINKKGKFLNNAEVQRSEFQETKFLKLSDELTSNQNFINLDLFNESTSLRLNDRDFVQELLGYLFMYRKDITNDDNKNYEGLRDKKTFIEKDIFSNDISEDEYNLLKYNFNNIIDKITKLDNYKRINSSRYRQRNDFFTLFNFINKNDFLVDEILLYQYKVLLELDKKDKNGNQFIRPTNEDCQTLKNYATNCVSQSNSKNARKARLDFFENILLNQYKIEEDNPTLLDLLIYLSAIFSEDKVVLKPVGKYFLLDISKLNNLDDEL